MQRSGDYFSFNAEKFLVDVIYLNNQEIGLYITLLSNQWINGKIKIDSFKELFGVEFKEISIGLIDKLTVKEGFVFCEELEGNRHGNWKGGITPENQKHRGSRKYIKWRLDVFKRDNYTCMICGSSGVELNAHHINKFSTHPHLRTELSNGLTLCVPCHKKEHKNGK